MTTPNDDIIYDAAGSPVGSRPTTKDEQSVKKKFTVLQLDAEAIGLLEQVSSVQSMYPEFEKDIASRLIRKIYQLYVSQIIQPRKGLK